MKKIILSTVLGLLSVTTFSQSNCVEKMVKVSETLTSKSPFKDYNQIFKDLKPCADSGNPEAQNYLGLLYIEGLGVEKDEKQGFYYIKKAAMTGYPVAQSNLGRLYKYGTGCSLSMAKAIDWFEKAAALNNQRAIYTLGYMYYKGLGVNQDYNQAVHWFKKSTDPMALHWLGVCYYFGYGVSQNNQEAVSYLVASGTPNSRAFMKHVKAEKKQKQETIVAKVLNEKINNATPIEKEVLVHAPDIIEHNSTLTNEDVAGLWVGKLIEYDESGTEVQRIFPIDINFTTDSFGDLKTAITFNKQTINKHVLFEDNNLFVDEFNFTLEKQYTHHPKDLTLDYTVLGMDFNKQHYHGVEYLLADVDAFINNWKEIAPPMSLVLRPKTDEIITEEEEAKLLALAQQKEEFIKLYPVPFESQLYIAFNLEQAETIQVKLTGINNTQTIVVEQGKKLQAGEQTYMINANSLPSGLYVIKVITDSTVHTRIVVKQ